MFILRIQDTLTTTECWVSGQEIAGLWDTPDSIVEAVSVCEAPAPCPDGSWTLGGPRSSCYKVFPPAVAHPMRRRSGATQCENAGAALAVIQNATENDFVVSVLQTALLDYPDAWPSTILFMDYLEKKYATV